MKKQFIFLFALAALLLFAGGRKAQAYTEPYVTWDPQSLAYAVGCDAEYSATVSGQNLKFTWYVEYGGKEYEMPAQKDALMNAGLKSGCDDVIVKSTANRTSIIFKNIKKGIDGSSGKWTRVYCHAFDGTTGVDTNWAHVSCNGYGLMDAGYPPTIYVKPVINLKPTDVGKISFDLIGEDVYYNVDKEYQWYHYKGGSYDKGLAAIPGETGSVYVSEAEPDKSEELVIGVHLKLNGGGDYWIFSSPMNVNRLSGDIDYSWDQLVLRRNPDQLKGYELGDKPDLTGLQVEYIANDASQGIVPVSSLTTDISTFTYAGPVWVTVSYKGHSVGLTYWVYPDEKGKWELDTPKYLEAQTSGVKMSYKTGETLDTSGLKVRVVMNSGASYVETDLSKFDIKCEPFKDGGIYTVHIYMKGSDAQGNYLVSVTPAETAPAPTTEAPTTAEPTTEAPATEAPTTEEPTQPETTETAPEPTETVPETTEAPAASSTEAPAPSTAAPVPSTEAAPNGGSSGGNTVLIILIIVMALVIGLLAGILMSRRKEK